MNGTEEDHTLNVAPEEGASDPPARVPARAKPAGERPGLPPRWAWADPTVWTPRMARALEDGVKGGVWALAHRLLRQAGALLAGQNPSTIRAPVHRVNALLESRMREIRLSGSAGGMVVHTGGCPYPDP